MKIKICRDKRNKSSPYVIQWSEGMGPMTGKTKWNCQAFKYKAQAEQFRAGLRTGVVEPQRRHDTKEVTLRDLLRD